MAAGEGEPLRMAGREVDEEVVEECGEEKRAQDLAEHRPGGPGRGEGPEEPRPKEGEDREEGDRGGDQPVEREGDPPVLHPLLYPSVRNRVEPGDHEEHGEGGEQGEDLRPLPHRPDEERLDVPGDPADGEVHRDLREKDPEPAETHREREGEAGGSRQDARLEAIPRELLQAGPEAGEDRWNHAGPTGGAGLNVRPSRPRVERFLAVGPGGFDIR